MKKHFVIYILLLTSLVARSQVETVSIGELPLKDTLKTTDMLFLEDDSAYSYHTDLGHLRTYLTGFESIFIRDNDSNYIHPIHPDDNFILGTSKIYPGGSHSIAAGFDCEIDTNALRGQNVWYGQAYGYMTRVHDWYGVATGVRATVDGKVGTAEGNVTLCTSYDSHAEGDRTVAGRQRYWITAHGVGSSTGVSNKAYVVVPATYGRVQKLFPNKLVPRDSMTSWYGTGVKRDKNGNIYSSIRDTAIYNANGTVLNARDLSWAMHPWCVIKGAREYEMTFERILKCCHSAVNGDTIFYDAASEPYDDVDAIYSSYGSTVPLNGDVVQYVAGNATHSEGYQTSAWGYGSHAEGFRTQAWGTASHSANFETSALGNYSTALGYWTTADAQSDVAIGQFNIGGGNLRGWTDTDFLFECGNGTSTTNKSNAFSVKKNGDVTVGGQLSIPVSTNLSGQILQNGSRLLHTYKPTANTGHNTFLGIDAGNFTMGSSTASEASENTGIGYESLINLTTGADNTMVGSASGISTTSGNRNTGVGLASLYSNTDGIYNTGVGYQSLFSNLHGVDNVGIGYNALYSNTASNNIGIGGYAGWQLTGGNNTVVGTSAGYSNTTGTGNVFLGYQAGYNETGSNKLYIMNSSADSASSLIFGNFNTMTLRVGGGLYVNREFNYGNGLMIDSVGYSTINIKTTGTKNLLLRAASTGIVIIDDVLKLTPQADPPGTPVEGELYADTDHHLYYYNGTTWKQLDN